MILAIDPGNVYTGWVLMDEYLPVQFGKDLNEEVLSRIRETDATVVIENIATYGMPVGREVFDTCIWIGRYVQANGGHAQYIYRREEKMTICGSMKANDATIRRALIDRFAKHDLKTGKGTAKSPDYFFGFRADVWQAFAVGVTWLDKSKSQ